MMRAGWIKVAAAGLGVAVAGPLGGALGGLLGEAVGGPAAELIATYADKFLDKAGEKLLELGGDSLVERVQGEAPELGAVYREALRVSLVAVRAKVGGDYADWFGHWEVCLAGGVPLRLEPLCAEQLVPQAMDAILRATLVRLDALGALRPGSIALRERALPDALLFALQERLPELLKEEFGALIVLPQYEAAWKRAGREFEAESRRLLRIIPDIKKDTAEIKEDMGELLLLAREIRKDQLARAEAEGRLSEAEAGRQSAEAAAADWERRYLEVVKANPSLQELLASGDLEGAAQKKEEQIARQKSDQAKSYFELGTIEELRFDFAKALDAYREAWRLEKNPEYGFKSAYCAQRQNCFSEAISVYEALRTIYVDPAQIATTLNNLAILYNGTQRMREAERAYDEALSVRRELAANNPAAYLPNVATTLNNLGLLYGGTQRMREAERAYDEALSVRRELAASNPAAYLPNVATTLNNLAVLYRKTQRMREAERAYDEALSVYRQLAARNTAAYLPDVAMTLNNLGLLYSGTQRMREAERAYDEALSVRRELAASNPAAYLPNVATTLNNLAILYNGTQRMREAKRAFDEALAVYRELAASNPTAYLPDVAMALNNLALFYYVNERYSEGEACCVEAEEILEPL